MIHLRMSGQVLLAAAGSPRPPHTHVVMHLDDGHEAWFVDPRTFGEVVVFDPDNVGMELPELARMGVDPIAEPFDPAILRDAFGTSRRALKPMLLDQHVIAGIGNIYADEILHRARLRPDRAASTLDRRQIRVLHASIVGVLTEAIEAGGSTLGDAQYVDLMGEGGSYQDDHRVYGRGGERCLDLWARVDPPDGDRWPRHPLLPRAASVDRRVDRGVRVGRRSERVVSLLLCS